MTPQQHAAAYAADLVTHYLRLACKQAGVKWDSNNESEMGGIQDAFAEMVQTPAEPAPAGAAHATADVPAAVHQLYVDFLEADESGASSNDIAQLLDDWLVAQGFPSVLYRPKPTRRQT